MVASYATKRRTNRHVPISQARVWCRDGDIMPASGCIASRSPEGIAICVSVPKVEYV